MKTKRYIIDSVLNEYGEPCTEKNACENGEWVKYEDYKKVYDLLEESHSLLRDIFESVILSEEVEDKIQELL